MIAEVWAAGRRRGWTRACGVGRTARCQREQRGRGDGRGRGQPPGEGGTQGTGAASEIEAWRVVTVGGAGGG